MKIFYTLITIFFIGFSSLAQTSVQNGNWMNPTTWDCSCVPSPFFTPIDITINHTVTADINSGGLYFLGGSLTIGANGTLLQSGTGDLFMKNATTLINGTLDMRRVAIEGGTGTYNGIVQNCDSLWSDSSTVINNGSITCYDHQLYPMGTMTNNGSIHMTHDMNIQGEYTNGANGTIVIDNDFSNANTFGGRALYANNGDHQIANNFINTTNDTIQGTGTICIGNLSTNQGTVLGTITVTTTTGGFNVNNGFVSPSVSFLTGPCSMSLNENSGSKVSVYPNPFVDFFTITGINQSDKIELVDIRGKLVLIEFSNGGVVGLGDLETGVYILKITTSNNTNVIKKVIKG